MRTGHLGSSLFGDPGHEGEDHPAKHTAERPGGGVPGVENGTPAPPEDGPGRVRRLRVRGTRRLVVLLVALGLVAGAGAAAAFVLWPLVSGLTASNDYTGGGRGAASVVVHDGDTSRTIGAALEKAGVVKTAKAFGDAAANEPRSGSVQPGTYALHAGMSAGSAMAMLLDPANRTVPRVTIREGLWTSEVIATLAAATGQPIADYRAALKDSASLGLPAAAKGNGEGYLFPSTYEFETNATAAEQLHKMVAKSLEELGKLGVTGNRMQRELTIASIVEAEVRATPDLPKVARVIENRLARSMRLQMDSTVHFVSQRRGQAGTTRAERLSRSPYNTYLVTGLPPGPINSPGLSAMKAAVSPAPGRWMYFVAVNPGTGETRFAVDPAAHAANVRLFQRWCSDHPAKC